MWRTAVAAILVALAVSGCGSGSGNSVSPATPTAATQTVTVRETVAAPASASAYGFRLPSGNILCRITAVVTCRVLSVGNENYVLHADGHATIARNDGSFAVPSRVLAYGRRVTRGGFVCASSVKGLFCRAERRSRGLFLSREQQLLDAAAPTNASPPPPPPPPPPSSPAAAADKDFAVEDLEIKDDGLGDIGGLARITNTASKTLTGSFTFTFFQSGQIVGTAIGSANDVGPGQTVTVQLGSQDPMISGTFHYQFHVDAEF
jgi:hypothetical protein